MSEVRRQVTLPPRPNWGWQDAAACRGTDVVLFFGPDGERQPERHQGAEGQGALRQLPGAHRVPGLRDFAAGEVRHLGRPERGRAGFRAPPPDAPR